MKPFDKDLRTELLTDASKLHGLGFALVQYGPDGKMRLVRCGSCSLTPAQKNYATIELEALAILYGIEKCSFFLAGCPGFQVTTDHRPLRWIFTKDLAELTNPRLLRVRERLTNYNFNVEWVAGKTHLIADALSRYPVFSPEGEAGGDLNADVEAARLVQVREEPAYADMLQHAALPGYRELVKAFRAGKCPSKLPDGHVARQYNDVWTRLSLLDDQPDTLLLLDAERVVVPPEARSTLLKQLHTSHAGFARLKILATSGFYWPGMVSALKNLCDACVACAETAPSKPTKTGRGGTPVTQLRPMDEVSVDLCQSGCDHYLVMVDRFSGMIWADKLHRLDTNAVTKVLTTRFGELGWPRAIRSDGGPQFRGPFELFCKNRGVKHELSSAYHHQSNGLAEAGVKVVKTLLDKCYIDREPFGEALAEYVRVPRSGCKHSPMFLFLGRQPRGRVPVTSPLTSAEGAAADREASMPQPARQVNTGNFQIGQRVLVQNMNSGKWDLKGSITGIREKGVSYFVDIDGGRVGLRNARFLRHAPARHDRPPLAHGGGGAPREPRRSKRLMERQERQAG